MQMLRKYTQKSKKTEKCKIRIGIIGIKCINSRDKKYRKERTPKCNKFASGACSILLLFVLHFILQV